MKNIAYISRGGLVKSPGLAACLSLLLLTIAWTSSGQVQNTGLQLTLTNNAVISTNSAWVSDAGSTTTNNGRIITSENWINNGTYAGASLGGFELKYATSKTFTLGGTQLARLRVNGTAGVSIPSLSITDSLTLVNGNVVLPVVTDVLTLQTGAKLIGGSTSSYVDGIMTRKGTGDLNFPLGKSSKFLPVIFYQVSGTSPALTVQVKAAPAFSPGAGVSILPSFPYAWSATTLSAADTATFVEIQYPISLLNVSNPIVVRNRSGQNFFDSMGAQSFTTTDPIKVKSLTPGLRGLFTVGQGLSGTLALNATAFSTSGFTANWTAVTGASGYKLDISTDNFATFIPGFFDASVSGTSQGVTGLTANTSYQYRVRVVDSGSGSTSLSSNTVTATTLTTPPVATAATSITSTGFTANWNTMTGATSYQLDVSSDNFVTFAAGYQSKSVATLSDVVTGLNGNTAYKYKVRAVNGGGASVDSNIIDITTLGAPPSAPVATAASAIAQTGFTANWNSVSGATGYQLDVSVDNFATFLAGYNAKSVTTTLDAVTGLTVNSAYRYRVRATNAGGASANSNAIDVTTTLSAPVATSASGITQTSFTANWNLLTGATGYQLDISTDNFTTFIAGYNSKNETGTSDIVTGLTASTAYKYRVRAVNAGGASVNSNVIDVTTVSAAVSQTISFPPIATMTIGDPIFTLNATASSGLPVSYTTTATKIVLVGNQVKIVAAGSVTITASQSGNSAYNTATPVDQTFCINPPVPVIGLSGANTETVFLSSSSSVGNQWYKDGVVIPGETNITLALKSPGSYTVIAKVDNCSSVTSAAQLIIITGDVAMKERTDLLLFPNPVREKLTIQLHGFEQQPVYLVVYDLNGRILEQLTGQGKGEVILDVSRYASGSYIIRASQQEKVAQQHFVKE